jgi:hypothetical protein
MTNSNYPNGFANGLTVRNLPVLNSYSNKVFWVDSVHGSNGNKGTFDRPFATVAYAIGLCADDVGDIIAVKSGHTETISAAGDVTVNKKGITIVGLGQGKDRPIFNFGTATTASVLITADNVTIQNIVGRAVVNALVNPFNVQALDCYLDIEWHDTATNLEAVSAVVTTAAAKRLDLRLRYKGQTGGSSSVNPVKLVGCAGARILIDFVGKASTAVVNFATTACTDIYVTGYMYNASVTDGSKDIVDTITGSTWFGRVDDGSAGATYGGGSASAWAKDDVSSVFAVQESVAVSAAAAMVNGNTLFTIAGGPIELVALVSVCVTGNDTTASTLQYQAVPTSGSAQTISGASASLASALAGASVALQGTALATAALLNANGPNLMANPGTIFVPAGAIKAVVGVGSTTGTWKHYLRFRPLASGVTVS